MKIGELRPEIHRTKIDREAFIASMNEREKRAYNWMIESFEGHLRDDKVTPFSDHCETVANILRSMGCDEDTFIAGLLHDLVEDHPEQGGLDEIKRRFGGNVAFLVAGVTILSIEDKNPSELETLQKVIRESGVDIRVSLIKLADRLHNMLTIGAKPLEKRRKKAEETLKVYVPLAISLGMWTFASYLADICYPHLDLESFKFVKAEIDADPRLEPMYVSGWINRIGKLLEKLGVEGNVGVLIGGYYEMSEKRRKSIMYEGGNPKNFSDITDLLSIRVVVNDNEDVYRIVSSLWREFALVVDMSKTEDMISIPAENGYRAIQLTLNDKYGPVEIAISTKSMEDFNRNGILSQNGRKMENPVMVFTPKGELMVFLPRTTALDMAYSVSWNLGLNADYVLINGRKEKLSYILKAGDLVEIIPVSKERSMPEKEWLEFGNEATKKYIREQFKSIETSGLQRTGRLLMEKGLSEIGMLNIQDLPGQYQSRLLMRIHCKDVDQLYVKLAIRPSYLSEVMIKIKEVVKEFKKDNNYDNLATVAITGDKDRSGLSAELSIMIGELGGNMLFNREKLDGKRFVIRRFVYGLDMAAKETLRRRLSLIEEFQEVIVV